MLFIKRIKVYVIYLNLALFQLFALWDVHSPPRSLGSEIPLLLSVLAHAGGVHPLP